MDNLNPDVIVVGTGFAGLTAAIEAKNCGASVMVIEKMKRGGGNSLLCDGGVAAAGTPEQEKAGIKDTPDLMYRDMMKAGLDKNSPDLVKILTERSNEVFQWSKDYLGVPYLDRIDIFGGHSVNRCYTAENVSGKTILKHLNNKIDELEIPVHTKTELIDLVKDGDRVTGVVVKSDEKVTEIKTAKGVIFATGGFGSDVEFRSKLDPRLGADIDSTTMKPIKADALKIAMKNGADTVDLKEIQLGPWASPDESGFGHGPMFSEYIVYQLGLMVNPLTGKRFVNELADRKTLSDLMLEIGSPAIGIADSAAVKTSGWDISKALNKGVVKVFETLNDLADEYNIDLDKLTETVNRFNNAVKDGKDIDFNKNFPTEADEIKTPPFYGIRLWPKVHHTMGGIKINTKAEVIDTNGKVLKGLYACGEAAGGVHGASRLGSCAITDCFVFGRIAGHSASSSN